MPSLSSWSPSMSRVPLRLLFFVSLVGVSPFHSTTESIQLCPLTVLFPFRVHACLLVCTGLLCNPDGPGLASNSAMFLPPLPPLLRTKMYGSFARSLVSSGHLFPYWPFSLGFESVSITHESYSDACISLAVFPLKPPSTDTEWP